MKRNLFMKTTMLAMVAVLIAGSAGATRPDEFIPIEGHLIQISSDASTGKVELELQLAPTKYCSDCNTLYVAVKGEAGLVHNGADEITREFSLGELVHIALSFVAPLDTVSSFWYEFRSGLNSRSSRIYIDTRKDPIWWGNQKPGARYTRLEQKRMRIGEAKLKEQVCISMDFRHGFGLTAEAVDSLLGGKLIPTDTVGVYTARTSLDTSLWLAHERRVWVSDLPDSLCPQLTPPPIR